MLILKTIIFQFADVQELLSTIVVESTYHYLYFCINNGYYFSELIRLLIQELVNESNYI